MNDTIIKALQKDREELDALDAAVQKAQVKLDEAHQALKAAIWERTLKVQRISILIGELQTTTASIK